MDEMRLRFRVAADVADLLFQMRNCKELVYALLSCLQTGMTPIFRQERKA